MNRVSAAAKFSASATGQVSRIAPISESKALAELRQAVGVAADGQDVDTLTEVFWAALHGLVTLSSTGRLRAACDSDRLQMLVEQFTGKRELRR